MSFMLFKGKQRTDSDDVSELVLPVGSIIAIFSGDDWGSVVTFGEGEMFNEQFSDDRSPSELFELLRKEGR